jgi:hypothetical protein
MSDSQSNPSAASMCEIIGCTSPAVATRWSMDENRHLQVCYKHSEEAEKAEEGK